MSQFTFGSGVLWGTPLTDATGTAIAIPTPVQFGTLQDCSVDISGDIKELYGQNQFAVAVGRGKAKIAGKAKFAQLNGTLINSLFFGQTMTNSIITDVYDTTGIAVPITPFTVTPTPPNSGVWSKDLGVRDATGLPMTRVTGTPTTGSYACSALGVYLFATADTAKMVYINYQYTAVSTTATTGAVSNVLMGYAPTFKADLYMPYNGKSLTLTLNNCISTKMSFATKLDDFQVMEFDFSAFADASGNALTWATTDR